MGLEPYQQRRNFERSPEPKGAVAAADRYRFVVQRHAARRLHFDFRLELDGVLKSWAIPKGPSFDPAEKRLAVHVEDHPLDYGEFEGVIPPGEYGAGAVQIWDRGEWEPLGDPRAGYQRGRLHFRLYGERLHGEWALARMGGRRRQEARDNWLLLKINDRFAGHDNGPSDAVSDEVTSIVTGRTLEGIAAGAPAHTVPVALPPEQLKPQFTTLVERPPEGDEWLHEIKFDGYRILARLHRGRARLFSRNGRDWSDRFPAIRRDLEQLPIDDAWLDGEVVIQQPDGTTSFQALQEALSQEQTDAALYFLFDLPFINGNDLRDRPLEARKHRLQALLTHDRKAHTGAPSGRLQFTDHIIGSGGEFFRKACAMHLEGVISKQRSAPYRSRRGPSWRKSKCLQRQEFVIGGYTEPEGSRSVFGALLVGRYEAGALRFAGRVGTGFSEQVLADLGQRLAPLARSTAPFADPPPPERRPLHWVEPRLVAEVTFAEWTRDGRLRQPVYHGLREDKDAIEVVEEQPAPPERLAAPNNGRNPRWALSNPDKVLYPRQGLTKRDLAHYYEAVAPYLLPHIRRRPLTLLRCPDGAHQPCFYQKHASGSLPPGIEQIVVPEKRERAAYLTLDSVDGLLGLVQLGVLEIHVWGARNDRLERPDRLIFDLDPDPAVSWPLVIEGALALRERLSQLGLDAFVRLTGGKGLHLVVPLLRRHDWAEVKGFARAVAADLVRSQPQRYVVTPARKARSGRIFIDYLRNSRGATAIANYSTRARPGAPVAIPIHWHELGDHLPPDAFHPAAVLERLQQRPEPWPGFFLLRQSITRAARATVGIL